jgi:uncharacterized protein (DUF1778 family)
MLSTALLNDLLDPLAHCFTPAVARQVVDLRLGNHIHKKLQDLDQRAKQGTLTLDQQAEYEAILETINVLDVLKEKSERILEGTTAGELQPTCLSERDRELFFQLLDNPPEPNEALKRVQMEAYHPTPNSSSANRT